MNDNSSWRAGTVCSHYSRRYVASKTRHSWLPEKSHVTPVNHVSPTTRAPPRQPGSTRVRSLSKYQDKGHCAPVLQLLQQLYSVDLGATVRGNSPPPRPADSDMGSEWSIIIQSSFCGILPWQAGGKVTRRPLGRKLLGKYLTVFSHCQTGSAPPFLITTLRYHHDVSAVSTTPPLQQPHFSNSSSRNQVYVSSEQS